MAEAAQYHQPSLQGDREQSAYPFLQTVGQASGKNDPATSSVSRRGRPSLSSYQEPDGAGAYQLRLKTSGGAEQQINFNVSGVEKAEPAQATGNRNVIDEEFITSLRRELKEEIRADYHDELNRLEQRLDRRGSELDEYAQKVLNLSVVDFG